MRGHIRQRGKRSWAIVLDLGRDSRGRRRQHWQTVRATKKDAERELTKLLHELDTGGYVEPHKLSVAEYLECWLADYVAHAVSPKTAERYTEIVRRHLVPALGGVPLTKLSPLLIQDYYSQALKCGRLDGSGGLSARSVLHNHRILRAALQQALRWQLTVRNVADAVNPPRPERPKIRILDTDELAGLMAVAERSSLRRPIFVALTTGMRRGELLALRWSAVDLERRIVSVNEALKQTKNGIRFKAPKSGRGRRTIDLLRITAEILREHRLEQTEHRLSVGAVYEDNDLIFARPDGTPWPPDKFSCAFAALMRRRGFKGLRFHDLRHTHASQLLKEGVHPKVVSERLGHASVAFTLDTYSHVLPGIQKEAAERIDRAVRTALARDES